MRASRCRSWRRLRRSGPRRSSRGWIRGRGGRTPDARARVDTARLHFFDPERGSASTRSREPAAPRVAAGASQVDLSRKRFHPRAYEPSDLTRFVGWTRVRALPSPKDWRIRGRDARRARSPERGLAGDRLEGHQRRFRVAVHPGPGPRRHRAHEPSTERRGPHARLGAVGRDRGGHARRACRSVRRPVLRAAPARHERRALRTGRRDDAVARQPFQGGDPEPHPVARAPRRRHRHRRQPGRSTRRRVARLRPADGAPRASAGGPVGELRRRRPRPRGRRDDLAPRRSGEAPDRPRHREAGDRRGRRSPHRVPTRDGARRSADRRPRGRGSVQPLLRSDRRGRAPRSAMSTRSSARTTPWPRAPSRPSGRAA